MGTPIIRVDKIFEYLTKTLKYNCIINLTNKKKKMLQYDSPAFNFISAQKSNDLQPFFPTKKRHESFCKDTEAVDIDHMSSASTVETAS